MSSERAEMSHLSNGNKRLTAVCKPIVPWFDEGKGKLIAFQALNASWLIDRLQYRPARDGNNTTKKVRICIPAWNIARGIKPG